jgi:hypothetical protein
MSNTDPNDLLRVEAKVDKLSADVQGLLDAWKTATGVVRFVKFLGGVGTAVAALWALIQLGSHK